MCKLLLNQFKVTAHIQTVPEQGWRAPLRARYSGSVRSTPADLCSTLPALCNKDYK